MIESLWLDYERVSSDEVAVAYAKMGYILGAFLSRKKSLMCDENFIRTEHDYREDVRLTSRSE